MNKIFRLLQQSPHQFKVWNQKMCSVPALNLVTEWKRKFEEECIDDGDFAIKCIMAHVLETNFSSISSYSNLHLNDQQQDRFHRLCECRIARMPIQYVLGNWDFREINFRMIPPVFIPRPETEKLVDLVMDSIKESEPCYLLEVGCGTGAISVSLLRELPKASIVALDSSRLACSLAKFNAKEADVDQRLNVIHHKVTEDNKVPKEIETRKFDAIVSNPPYIKSSDIMKLAPEIKLYEDLRALDGGPDGLKIIKILCSIAESNLSGGGKLWLEVDSRQIKLIREIIDKRFSRSLEFLNSHKDMYKHERFVEIARQ